MAGNDDLTEGDSSLGPEYSPLYSGSILHYTVDFLWAEEDFLWTSSGGLDDLVYCSA